MRKNISSPPHKRIVKSPHTVKQWISWLDSHEWMLRSSNNGISYNDFRWKKIGRWNIAPDWNDHPKCGSGLHGNAPEAFGYGFDYVQIELVETRGPRIPIDGNKIKVQCACIRAINDDIPAEAFARCKFTLIQHKPGDRFSPKNGEIHFCSKRGDYFCESQSGGSCRVYGNATLNVQASQSGGSCWACGNATLNVQASQSGGSCRAYDNATLNVQAGQSGGSCRVCENATLNAK